MTERSAGLPSQKQVIELLDGEFARAGYEIEDVVIDTTARPPRITVVADGDEGLDLDSIAALSRSASELLDRLDTAPDSGTSYVLEVTSPGVDRPLTTEKHFRRARGRKVELTLSDGSRADRPRGRSRRRRCCGWWFARAGGPTSRCANYRWTASPKPLSRLSFRLRTSASWSWPANLGRRLRA